MQEIKILQNKKDMRSEKDFIKQVSTVYETKAEFLPYLKYFLYNFFKTDKRNVIVILKENGKIISLARFDFSYGINNLDMKNKILITGLQTLPEKRGQGCATKVISVGIDFLTKRNPKFQICLGVNKENLSAIKLYEKLGFKTLEEDQEISLPYFSAKHQFFMRYFQKEKTH